MEEAKEKEMTQQHQTINYRSGGGRGDRRGSKPMGGGGGGDEWKDRSGSKEVREKFDQTKVTGILARRKEKGAMAMVGSMGSLGPNTALRPGGWKKPSASISAPVDKSKPSR